MVLSIEQQKIALPILDGIRILSNSIQVALASLSQYSVYYRQLWDLNETLNKMLKYNYYELINLNNEYMKVSQKAALIFKEFGKN